MIWAHLFTKVRVGTLALLVALPASVRAAAESTASTAPEEIGLTHLLGAGFVGAVLVKFLEFLFQEYRKGSERRRTARRFVDENLDPVLKAADEVVGKLRSLAADDFRTLRQRHSSNARHHDCVDVLYLFAKLWASLEVFRGGGQTVSVVRDKRGKRLTKFVDCMESRRVRIVRRSSQRTVAELALVPGDGHVRSIWFIDFARQFQEDREVQRWLSPLTRVLDRMEHTSDRQRLLRYGIVIHAMIDTLDPHHQVSRDRPSYPHKLSRKSWRDLKYRVFRVYLKFVKRTQKYLGSPGWRP